ncbi:hypothetical protein PSY24_23380, partial [Shigella flexneri]|nr:hypothetical protein [Shigella flexneri]
NSDKRHIGDEKQSDDVSDEAGADLEDSEDDEPLSVRILVLSNSRHANKRRYASSPLGHMPKNPGSEDSDDEIPLAYKFLAKSNAGEST